MKLTADFTETPNLEYTYKVLLDSFEVYVYRGQDFIRFAIEISPNPLNPRSSVLREVYIDADLPEDQDPITSLDPKNLNVLVAGDGSVDASELDQWLQTHPMLSQLVKDPALMAYLNDYETYS